jgi:hypothetical protein
LKPHSIKLGLDYEKDDPILLCSFNPYLRPYTSKAILTDNSFKRHRYYLHSYLDLRNQSVDIVRMWIRLNQYDLKMMGRLSQANWLFHNKMEDHLIWFEALQFHFGQTRDEIFVS